MNQMPPRFPIIIQGANYYYKRKDIQIKQDKKFKGM